MSAVDQVLSFVDDVPETFVVEVMGVAFTFKRPKRYRDLKAFWKAQNEFVAVVFEDNALPKEWKEHLPESADEAKDVYMLHYWSADPSRLSQSEAMRLVASWPPLLVNTLIRKVAAEVLAVAANDEYRKVEEAKKGLKATPGSDSVSPSPGTSTGDIPTS